MSMFFRLNTRLQSADRGSALVIALIVLAILGALGVASLDVADMNIMISANDRDAKEAFFRADSGVNIGHVYLEKDMGRNATYYYRTDASTWVNDNPQEFNATDYPLSFYINGTQETFIRFGLVDRENIGSWQMASGYEGNAKTSMIKGTFLIRSHQQGKRNSLAEVDIGWINIFQNYED